MASVCTTWAVEHVGQQAEVSVLAVDHKVVVPV